MIHAISHQSVLKLLQAAPAFTPYGVALLKQPSGAASISADDFVIATTEAVKEHKAIQAIANGVRKLPSIAMSAAALDEL